jgi:hypothetical protein
VSDAMNETDGVWIACRQTDARGVFRPLPIAASTRADEVPTEAALQDMAAYVEANVALPGGEQGPVQGYLTGDGDLYVLMPQELVDQLVEVSR